MLSVHDFQLSVGGLPARMFSKTGMQRGRVPPALKGGDEAPVAVTDPTRDGVPNLDHGVAPGRVLLHGR